MSEDQDREWAIEDLAQFADKEPAESAPAKDDTLLTIAKQKLFVEMNYIEQEYADWFARYEALVTMARAAVAKTE